MGLGGRRGEDLGLLTEGGIGWLRIACRGGKGQWMFDAMLCCNLCAGRGGRLHCYRINRKWHV